MRAAIDATAQLLDRLPEEAVTLEAVRERSGVSQGSLTHHFGGRDGLIAAAHVERYAISCAADEQFLEQLDTALTGPEHLVPTLIGMIDDMLSDRRRDVRWLRMSAIAAALGDEALTATLSRIYTNLTDRLTGVVEQGHASGMLLDDVDARTVALLLSMHAQGLVLDDVSGVPVDRSGWNHIQARFAGSFLTPEVGQRLVEESDRRFGDLWRIDLIGRSRRTPIEVSDRLSELRTRAGHAIDTPVDAVSVRRLLVVALHPDAGSHVGGWRTTDRMRAEFLDAAVARLRVHGARGVNVSQLRREMGVSAQGFHRLFGTRDELIREARLDLEANRTVRATARFAAIVATSRTPADIREALTQGAVRIASEDAREHMWQRIETIAASRTDPDLREGLARIQRVSRDLLTEQVCLAQRRDLIDDTLPSSGLARLLEGSMFWHVFHGLDDRRPALVTWTGMLSRVAGLISPDR